MSKVIKKMKSLKERVETSLKLVPSFRDDDNKLIVSIWMREIKDFEISGVFEFLDYFKSGKISNPTTITRVRRKLQQDNPHLRGGIWKVRHEIAEEVKHEIKDL